MKLIGSSCHGGNDTWTTSAVIDAAMLRMSSEAGVFKDLRRPDEPGCQANDNDCCLMAMVMRL